ncbi:MAG TPA: UDP-N-acetylmuramoyl-L-alanyl-D-glutamate--2,6-diaminopimelate ligase [Planctomycetaceae bacterium]|nr:UDP-N-acetylmuramoyl-L-alanyl-D-glutamate--2,6-diaminopimelate ligase [Planctomycetaceae bacterium]
MKNRLGAACLPASLRMVFPHSSFVGCADVRVSSVACHSSLVQREGAFVVISGSNTSGASHVPEALRKGATALILESPLANVNVPQCIIHDSRKAYARLASIIAGSPSRKLNIAAVTGTNGKTSINWILRSIVAAGNERCGLLGTIEYSDGVTRQPATLTTPDAVEIQFWLKRMVENSCRYTVMEASSHALDQSRLEGVNLSAAVITNITRDHLDYHPTRQHYIQAKAKIARYLSPGGLLVVNADDPGAVEACRLTNAVNVQTYGLESSADLRGRELEESIHGSRFSVEYLGSEEAFSTPLVGRHQVSNCLAAIAVARHWNIPDDQIRDGLSQLSLVPGRLQKIENDRGLSVFIDYAHTPDALQQSLTHLQQLTPGRLIVVFGAGGDRDRSKRPLMGKIATQADLAVVTSDNPRSENPEIILDEILIGMRSARQPVHREADRAAAIRWALAAARPGDTVLVAGKGHETTQTIGNRVLPFDDAEIVRNWHRQHPAIPEELSFPLHF